MSETSSESPIDQLAKLSKLKADGTLTDTEFQSLKSTLLEQLSQPSNENAGESNSAAWKAEPTSISPTSDGAGVGFGGAISSCYSKYATFAGRAPRSELWFFSLFSVLGMLSAIILDIMIGTNSKAGTGGVFYALFALVNLLPSISVQVRRLHDLDRSGWWVWICLIPLIGFIILLVWWCTKGTTGDNRFGADPLATR